MQNLCTFSHLIQLTEPDNSKLDDTYSGIIQPNPVGSHRLSIFWSVTVVKVWCDCHYLQHLFMKI